MSVDRCYFDDNTLFKVQQALRFAGLSVGDVTSAIIEMQNAGILFRERLPEVAAVGTSATTTPPGEHVAPEIARMGYSGWIEVSADHAMSAGSPTTTPDTHEFVPGPVYAYLCGFEMTPGFFLSGCGQVADDPIHSGHTPGTAETRSEAADGA